MKIISLNTWGGRAGKEKLLEFIGRHKDSVDIFCLQEIWSAPYDHLEGFNAGGRAIDHAEVMTEGLQAITQLLDGHVAYFCPQFGDNYGLLTLVRKGLVVQSHGDVYVHKDKDFVPVGDVGLHARNIQFLTLEAPEGLLTVMNFHGLWNGQGKTDSDDRLTQSKNILKFMATLTNDYILCGDFNLLPDTQSLQMFEQAGLRNLIKEFGVTSTRTSLYTKPEKFADYVFTSPNVKVEAFEVLKDEVSDHAPLSIEIS